MIANINKREKLKLVDLLIIICVLSVEYGNVGRFGISQYLIGIAFIYIMIKYIPAYSKVSINLKKVSWFIFFILYVLFITALFNPDFIAAIRGLLYLCIALLVFIIYTKFSEKSKIVYILYQTAFFVALLGIIEETLFFVYKNAFDNLLLSTIYERLDILHLGYTIIRVSSVFSEPAHLATLFSIAVAIIIEKYINENKNQFTYVNKYKNIIILICALLTFSMIVYISLLLVIFIYLI